MEFTEGAADMKLKALNGWIGLLVFSACLAAPAYSMKPALPETVDPVGGVDTAGPDAATDDTFNGAAFEAEYERVETDRYDALSSSPSPRQQVLAGQISLDDEDETPALVRPKRADVVARAVQLAPDDAFVQWMAASVGNYWSSQCGPTPRPEQEVANLVRLEPDNVAAWQFAVALASSMGDQAGVDDALSRMAAAAQADDHLIQQIDEWTRAYTDHPAAAPPWEPVPKSMPADAKARLMAMQKVSYRASPAASVVKDVCKMEVSTDRIWQRMGWCADAATTLAMRGTSLDLREQGLELLAAIGQTTGTVEAMQRSHDWLQVHDANPTTNLDGLSAPEAALADWHEVKSEIEAIERRLRRLGLPLEPPPTWTLSSESNQQSDPAMLSFQAYSNYLQSLVEAMQADSDVRLQAIAATADTRPFGVEGSSIERTSPSSTDAIIRLTTEYPDNLLVQWMAAQFHADDSSSEWRKLAIARVQQLDPENGASWVFSLSDNSTDINESLARIAATLVYDDHSSEVLGLWLATAERNPPSAEIVGNLSPAGLGGQDPADSLRVGSAMMMTSSLSTNGIAAIAGACSKNDTARTQSCTAVARLLLHRGKTLIATVFGENILRRLDALDPDDKERARQIAWWRESLIPNSSDDGTAMKRFIEDTVSTRSEVEAMHLAARRAGKETPPESWQAPPAVDSASSPIPEG
jgi:hypothetical protein